MNRNYVTVTLCIYRTDVGGIRMLACSSSSSPRPVAPRPSSVARPSRPSPTRSSPSHCCAAAASLTPVVRQRRRHAAQLPGAPEAPRCWRPDRRRPTGPTRSALRGRGGRAWTHRRRRRRPAIASEDAAFQRRDRSPVDGPCCISVGQI